MRGFSRERGAGLLFLVVSAPFVYPLDRLKGRADAVAVVCPPFLLRVGWLCAVSGCRPVFFDSLCARYAQRRILCALLGLFVCASHGAVLSCGACCGVWGCPARVGVWSVWRSARP